MRNVIAPIRKNATYSIRELFILSGYALLGGFTFSFSDILASEPSNFIIFSLFSFLILLGLTYITKASAVQLGQQATFQFSKIGIFATIFVAVLSGGTIPFFIPPGFILSHKHELQVGRFFSRTSQLDYLYSSFFAPVIVQLCIWLLYSLELVTLDVFSLGITIVFFSLLPFDLLIAFFEKNIGASLGMSIMFKDRTVYVMMLLYTICGFLLIPTMGFLIALVFTIVLTTILGGVYFVKKEI